MSTITNNFGLPEPLVRAVQWSDRDREGCDYTVTELLRPARQVALEQIHRDEITEDASDRLWLLLGSAGHEVLERAAVLEGGIVEERAIVEVEVPHSVEKWIGAEARYCTKTFKVGGKLDYGVSDKTLYDFKFTSVWAAKEGPKEEWVQQLNIYRWLAGRYGVAFDKLQIVAIFRDWSKPKASREPDYPQSQVKVMDLPLWRDDTTEQFIIDRIRAHEAAKVSLPECSPEEMWEKPKAYAVKKAGAARAKRVFTDYGEAESYHSHFSREDRSLVIEERPSERPRCESYCRVAFACSQFQQFKQQNKTT